MYAAAAAYSLLSTRPSISLLPATATATTTKRFHTIVSAQLRPTTSKDDNEFNQQIVGSIGHAVLKASSDQIHLSTNKNEPEPQQLSGSDVLWALRKATAEKAKRKVKIDSQTGSSTSGSGAVRGGKIGTEGRIKSVPDVQPLQVKEEWGIRLEELQNKLDELKIETI